MEMPEFIIPSFLHDQDAETIHQRMMEMLPPDMDDTAAGFPWDFTKPTALEKAELLEFFLVETLKIMFPAWSYAEWLDLHARAATLSRKPPNQAAGVLEVTGTPGTIIPRGFRFATPSIEDSPSVEYEAKEEIEIDEGGVAEVPIIATEAGTTGNVPAGTIKLMMTPINGITSIANPDQVSGGTEEESDEDLRRRIAEKEAAGEASYVGNDGDYKRWAEEIPGVGRAHIIAEWDGPGTVKIIITDANGEPGNPDMIQQVYNSIMRPDDRIERKAPVGAIVTVTAPEPVTIDYYFKLEIKAGEEIEVVVERIRRNLKNYYERAKAEDVVKFIEVGAVITRTAGVKDFSELTINGETDNINLAEDEYPTTGTIDPGGEEE